MIDMTCGNGQDTLFLASLMPKRLVALDIQPSAIERTRALVPQAECALKNHALYPDELANSSIKLAVYNLGWLPGSDKTCTTLLETTLKSVKHLLPKIQAGGMISLTCYPGHPEGEREEEELIKELQQLDPFEWNICLHRWLQRQRAPSLLLLQKKIDR